MEDAFDGDGRYGDDHELGAGDGLVQAGDRAIDGAGTFRRRHDGSVRVESDQLAVGAAALLEREADRATDQAETDDANAGHRHGLLGNVPTG